MKITCTAQAGDDAAELQCDHTPSPGEIIVIMVKCNSEGKPVIDSFEPLEIDDHDDTLRQIGGRVVAFAEGKA